VKFCGRPMHEVVDKFRFLNELIKMVSPKVPACAVCSSLLVRQGCSGDWKLHDSKQRP